MTIYDWPTTLGVRGIAFNPRGMTVAGPPTLSGATQVTAYDAGYWIASASLGALGAGAKLKLARALRALLEGGAHQIRVPAFDRRQSPFVGAVYSVDPVPFDDGALFDDGAGFSQLLISVLADGVADLRATAIDVTVLSAGEIIGGEFFSIGDRLYLIKQILADDGAGAMTFGIWPPLREAIADGTPLNFDRPVCRMRLSAESSFDLGYNVAWTDQPEMSFVEVF